MSPSVESSTKKLLSIFLCSLIIISVFSYIPISSASSHTDPPPKEDTFTGTAQIDVWQLSVFPLRTDTSNAQTVVQNANYDLIDVDNQQKSLKKDSVGIYNPDDTISISFSDGRANYAGFDENDHVQLIAAKLDENADVDDATTFSGALDLLNKSNNANQNATFYLVNNTKLNSSGGADFSFKPNNYGKAGQYVFFLGHNESNKNGFQVSNGDLSVDGNVTVIGVETASVQKKASGVSAPSAINRGNNLTISPDVSDKISGQHVRHIVVLFDENKFQNAEFDIKLNEQINDDFNITENTTLKHSIAEVNGVGRLEGDISSLGVNMNDGEVSPSPSLPSIIDFISEEVTGPDPDTKEIAPKSTLNASMTVINGSASETIDVETFQNWSTGQYRWVHIAVGKDSTELVSDTDTINIQKPVSLSLSADDTSITEGDSVTFTVKPAVNAKVSGDGKSSNTGGNGKTTITFNSPGSYTLDASKGDTNSINYKNSNSVTINVESEDTAPAPANIQYSNLQVSPTVVDINESVTINATVSNTGGQSGTFNATLKINGTVKNFTTNSLNADQSTTVQFTRSFDNPGKFDVTIDGLSAKTVTVNRSPANIQYSSLQVSPTVVDTNQSVVINATVTNTGGQSDSFNATLKVNNTIVDFTTGTLDAGNTTVVEFTRSFAQPGQRNVTIDGLTTQTVTINQPPANITYSNLQVSNTTVLVGEPVTINATVENTGASTGSFDAELTINGTEVANQSGTLAAGESQTLSFNRTFSNTGKFEVSIATLPAKRITVQQPANVTYSNLTLSATTITQGEDILISATISNSGTVEDSFTPALVIDGETVATKTVTLPGGASQTVKFTRTFNEAGEFAVTINGLATQNVTVNAPANISIVAFEVAPQDVRRGEEVVATATLENTGDLESTFNVTFSVDGEAQRTENISVAGGATETATFNTSFQEAGQHTISIDGFERTVTVLSPAAFEFADLNVSKTTVNVTEPVVVTTNVTNTGGISGIFTANLSVNQTRRATQQGVLSGGQTQTVRFSQTFLTPGKRSIRIEGLGPVIVRVKQPDTTPPSIVLRSPSPGAVKYGTPIDLRVSDNRQLKSVQYTRNTSNGTVTLQAPYRINTSGWPEGPTRVTVTATDATGNTLEKNYIFDLVSQPSIDSVAPLGKISTTTPVISVTYSDGTKAGDLGIDPNATRLFIDGRKLTLDSANVTTLNETQVRATVPAAFDLQSGQHIASAVVADDAGHRVIRRWRFSLDVSPPTTSVNATPRAAVSTNKPTTAQIQAIDRNLKSVEFIVRDAETGETIFTENVTNVIQSTTGAISIRWGATSQLRRGSAVSSGSYELLVRATDSSGNTGQANTTVSVDNDRPTLTFRSVTPSITNGTITVRAAANGTQTSISSVVFVAARAGTGTSERRNATLSNGNWSRTIDISNLPDGSYRITGNVTDQAGNTNSSLASTKITLDTVPPGLAASINTNGEINVTSTEALPEPPSLTLTTPEGDVQSVSLTAADDSNTRFTGSVDLNQSGTYTIDAQASDTAGNRASDTDTATVSREPTTNNELVVLNENTGIFLRIRTSVELQNTFVTLSESDVPFAALPQTLIGGHFIDGETAAALADQENVVNVTIGIPADPIFFPRGIASANGVAISFFDPGPDEWIAQPTRVDEVTLPDGTSGTYLLTTVDHLSTYGTTATDNQAPNVSLVTPTDGETFGAGTSTVETRFDIADNQSGIDIDATEVNFDGKNVTSSSATSITTDQITYTASDLSPGQHTVTVTVADQAGNTQQGSVTFTVESDTTGPEVTITQPESGSLPAGTTSVNLSVSYTDPETGINTDNVTVLLDGNDITAAVSPSSSGIDSEITGLDQGNHSIVVQVENGAGIENEVTRNFSIEPDTSPPTVTFENPTANETFSANQSQVRLNVTYTDPGSGIDSTSIQVFFDGLEITDQAVIDENKTVFTSDSLLSNTSHTYTIRVSDSEGLTRNASVNFSIRADTKPPIINLTPADDATLSPDTTSTQVSIAYDDTGAGVDTDSITVLFNGNVISESNLTVTDNQATFTASGLETGSTSSIKATVLDNAGNVKKANATFSVASPADIVTRNASLSTQETPTGQSVTITATLENLGSQSGTTTVNLSIDGIVVEQQSVTVAGGQTKTVSFTRTFDESGIKTINVNGELAGVLTVTQQAPRDIDFYRGDDNLLEIREVQSAIQDWKNRTISLQLAQRVILAWAEKPRVVGDQPAKSIDDDPQFEDVNGDGRLDIIDVGALLANRESEVVQNNANRFDFNGDGRANIIDVGKLLAEVVE